MKRLSVLGIITLSAAMLLAVPASAAAASSVSSPSVSASSTAAAGRVNGHTIADPATAAAGGTITGKVTAARGGAALSGICVGASRTGTGTGSRGGATTADGTYQITGLAAGTYDVLFSTTACGNKGSYLTQWYKGQSSQASASPVTVTAGATTPGINAAMVAGGTITGKVTAASGGAALSGICVQASPTGGGLPFGGQPTAADGTYKITGLAAGTYDVSFFSGCGNEGSYLAQWYNGQSSRASANPVTVTAGTTTPGINAAMVAGGTITGKVTAANGGAALSGICVQVSPTGAGPPIGGQPTAADGTYQITGLATGTYDVEFSSSCGNTGSYVAQWYNGQSSLASANPVTVTAGTTTPDISAALT